MANISLKHFKIERIDFCNKLNSKQPVQFRGGSNFKIKYAPVDKTCMGRSIIQLKPTDISLEYGFELEMVGIFSYDPEEDKREVHVEVAKTMHQYMVDVGTALMQSAGGPVLKMPEFTMTVDDVKMNNE